MDLTMQRYFLMEVNSITVNSITEESRPMTFEERMDYILADVEVHIQSSDISGEAMELYARLTHRGKEKMLRLAFNLR